MRNRKFISQYIEGYVFDELECAKNRSPHTIKSYLTSLKLLIIHVSEIKRVKPEKLLIDDLGFDEIDSFMRSNSRKGRWEPRTWNNRLAGVRAFVSYLALINPKYLELYRRVKLISCQNVPNSDSDYLTREQLQLVLKKLGKNKIEIRDRAMICMFFSSGIRNAELTALKCQDISWKSSKQVSMEIIGKGRKKRILPIFDQSTIQSIQELIKLWGLAPLDRLFCSRNYTKMSEANVRRIITKYFQKEFPNKNITPHSLRHSATMNWLANGVDIFTISSTLGHTKVATTQIYARSRYELREQRLGSANNLHISETKFKTKFSSNADLIRSLNIRIARSV